MQTSTSSANRSSIVRYLSVTGLSLWALVMALAPDPGFSAPWHWISLFWAMQIAVGLTVLQTTLYLLSRADPQGRMPMWSLVAVSGFCGAAVLTPIYWMIGEGLMQQVLGFAETLDADELISVQQTFGWAVLVDEWLDISGPVIAAWALISWPRLQSLLPPLVQSPKKSVDEPLAAQSQVSSIVEESAQSLQEVEDAEGSAGRSVHRSWWVNARHVRTVRRSGEAAICELSDGRELPVSRRRKADAVARFGDRAHYEDLTAASSDARSPTRSDQNARRNPT